MSDELDTGIDWNRQPKLDCMRGYMAGILDCIKNLPRTRELALVKTKIEEAEFWLSKEIIENGE